MDAQACCQRRQFGGAVAGTGASRLARRKGPENPDRALRVMPVVVRVQPRRSRPGKGILGRAECAPARRRGATARRRSRRAASSSGASAAGASAEALLHGKQRIRPAPGPARSEFWPGLGCQVASPGRWLCWPAVRVWFGAAPTPGAVWARRLGCPRLVSPHGTRSYQVQLHCSSDAYNGLNDFEWLSKDCRRTRFGRSQRRPGALGELLPGVHDGVGQQLVPAGDVSGRGRPVIPSSLAAVLAGLNISAGAAAAGRRQRGQAVPRTGSSPRCSGECRCRRR